MSAELQGVIEAAWDARDTLGFTSQGAPRDAVNAALDLLDSGEAHVAEKQGDASIACI